jgi:phage tail-like protein
MDAFYPPPAFYFKVEIDGKQDVDTSFTEVSGIKYEMEMDTAYHEGGENTFLYSLPKAVKHPNLVLKRGIGATYNSPLVQWCQTVLESGQSSGIVPKAVGVKLLIND